MTRRMARLAPAAALAVLAALPVTATGPAAATVAATGCTVTDSRITEGSGLLATDDGFRVVNDGGDTVVVYRLNTQCEVTGVTTAAIDPYDVEDLAAGPDGSLWVGDLGDNNVSRASIAIVVLPDEPGQVTGLLRRLAYPDGAHDAESLMVDDDGRAVVVTKTFSGAIGIYRSVAPLDLSSGGSTDPQPLEKVGTLQMRQTGTAGGPVGPPISNLMTTGAARCADRVVLRTYTDLYVWSSTGEDGDPVAAMTETDPAVVAAPSHAQGESVALSPDCQSIFTHGEGVGVPIEALDTPPVDTSTVDVQAEKSPAQQESTTLLIVGASVVAVVASVVLWRSWRRPRH